MVSTRTSSRRSTRKPSLGDKRLSVSTPSTTINLTASSGAEISLTHSVSVTGGHATDKSSTKRESKRLRRMTSTSHCTGSHDSSKKSTAVEPSGDDAPCPPQPPAGPSPGGMGGTAEPTQPFPTWAFADTNYGVSPDSPACF